MTSADEFVYLAILAGCSVAPIALEVALKVRVFARWRRLVMTVVPVLAIFTVGDAFAVHAHLWTYARRWITGVMVFGGLPIEELVFFAVIPICAIATLEAVRRRRPTWTIGDEP